MSVAGSTDGIGGRNWRRLTVVAILWLSVWRLPAAEGFRLPPFPPEVLVYPAGEVVALQALAPLVGCAATQDLQSGIVTVTRQGRSFACDPLSTAAESNGRPVTLPLAPVQRQAVLYLPLRPLVTALGGTVASGTGVRQPTLTVTLPGLAQPLVLPTRQMAYSPGTLRDTAANLYLMHSDGSGLRRLTYYTVDTGIPVASPDGKMWAYTYDGSLFVQLTGIATPVCLSPARNEDGNRIVCRRPIFNKDSSSLYYMEERTNETRWWWGPPPDWVEVCRIDIIGGAKTVLAKGNDLRASRDGAIFAYSDTAQVLHVLDAAGKPLATFQGRNPVIAPDGARIVFSAYENGRACEKVYQLRGVGAGTTREANDLVPAPITSACFSQDGSALLYTDNTQGGKVITRLTEANLKNPRELLQTAGINIVDPQFSPDGTQVFENNTYYSGCLYTIKTDGTGYQQLTHKLLVRDFALSPDGKQILFVAAMQ